jgi:two-component system, OmpR family, sensor histidine kinase ChvG
MALETERSNEYSLDSLASLKSGASDVRGLIAKAGRRLVQTSRAAAAGTANGTAAVVALIRRRGQNARARLSAFATAPGSFGPLQRWFRRQPIVRFFSASLLRRILISNLMGFFILLGGILYLGWFHTWLIDAKLDALKTQGKIIADAIAANATVVREHIMLDPTKLPDTPDVPQQFDDGLAVLELSIHPEDVTPILRKLIQPTNTRARVYARDGTLIVDTARSLAQWTALRHEPNDKRQPKTQNVWTMLTRYFFKEPLPVYQEIGSGNGMAYKEVRVALQGEERSMLLLNKKGEQIVSMALPIRRFKNVQGVLLLSTLPGQIDKILREERTVILVLAAIALLASVVTSLLLARTVAGPMRRLSAAADQVSRNIAAPQQLPELADRSDEVGQMAGAFQAMTAALYKRIQASEKFAADVAHELKNPLTAARSTAESLGFAKTQEERDQLIEQIQIELKRLNRLITDVSNASRLDAELARKEMLSIDVTTMLRNIMTIFRDIIGGDSRRIELSIAPEPYTGAYFIVGDEGRLGQVLTNLLDNAISFSPEGGVVTVRARASGPFVEISVEDQGPGIPADRLEIVFDRFYSDRPATDQSRGKNSGLGLSISREIAHAHGGQIVAENRCEAGAGPGTQPAGATFIVRLPIAGQAQRGGAQVGRRT